MCNFSENVIQFAGPMGPELPIIASSMVLDINDFINKDGSIDLPNIDKSMAQFKNCGFNGFMAHFQLANDKSNQEILESLLENVLNSAKTYNLFAILGSNIFLVPSEKLIEYWKTSALQNGYNSENNSSLCSYYIKNFEGRISKFIEFLNNYDSFGGVVLQDEPKLSEIEQSFPINGSTNINDYDNVNGRYYCLSNRYRIVKSMLKEDAVIMVNLIGSHDEQTILEHKGYENYLKAFSNILGRISYPYLWSYDLYPITESNYLLEKNYESYNNKIIPNLSNNGDISVLYKEFYDDLKLFHQMTSSKGSIFWTFIQSMEYMALKSYHPIAKEEFLRFAIFSSLAMGCQGIMYWTYHQRLNQSKELYLSAPLDRDSNKTPVWFYAQRINSEIRKYNYIFRYCKLEEWYLTYNMGSITKEVENMGLLVMLGQNGLGVLATRISNASKEYIVVVNSDVCNYQNVKLYFDCNDEIIKDLTIDDIDNQTVESRMVSRTLKPGGYIIFEYEI